MSCSVCQLPFAEAVHHSPVPPMRPRQCPFCSAVFSRVDSARRHAKCCPQRRGRALHVGKRGRKKNSCDQCWRVKVHCNARNQNPCDRCASRKLHCTFSRCCTDASHQPTAQVEVPESRDRCYGRVPLSFLLNITDDKQDFIAELAVGEEPDGVLLGPTCASPPQVLVSVDETLNFIDPTLLLPSDSHTFSAPLDLGRLCDIGDQSLLGALLSPRPQEDRLSARLDVLESQVAAHCGLIDEDPFDSNAFRRFFNVSNVHSFAMTFCRKRHYQYPIIHWPTFTLEEAALPLLMIVSLTGATYSYSSGDGPECTTNARKLYYLADSYVFHQLEAYLDGLKPGYDIRQAIELLQAALLMYSLDVMMTGDSYMRRTAITKRLPTLVSAVRRLDFAGFRHEPSESWQLFLLHEQIVRLVSWTFCADCLATLACNNPPSFSMLEMTGDLPCDSALWDADSAPAFELLRAPNQSIWHCLKDLMSGLFENSWRMDDEWENVPLFHLHVMLCAFQQVVFNLHVTMSLIQQSEKLLQTLATWGYLWRRAMDKVPHDQRKWLGVSKNVPEIEYLSRRVIEVAVGPEGNSSPYLQRIPSYSTREAHQFIRDFVAKTK